MLIKYLHQIPQYLHTHTVGVSKFTSFSSLRAKNMFYLNIQWGWRFFFCLTFLIKRFFSALIFSWSWTWFFAEFHVAFWLFSELFQSALWESELAFTLGHFIEKRTFVVLTTPKICLFFLFSSTLFRWRSHFMPSVFSLFEECPRTVDFASSVFTRIESNTSDLFVCLYIVMPAKR